MPLVETERRKMRELADALHAGELSGYTGRPITDIVNIGIGGSDLGIVMAVQALAEYRKSGPRRALRLEHRRRRARARACSESIRDDAVRDLLQELHDTGDARRTPRTCARGCSSAAGRLRSRRSASRCRRITRRWTSSASRRIAVSRCGTGSAGAIPCGRRLGSRWRSRLVGSNFERVLGRRACDGRAFRATAARRESARAARARRNLESKFSPGADARGAAVRRPPRSFPGLSATARDGEQRQVGAARRASPSSARRAR